MTFLLDPSAKGDDDGAKLPQFVSEANAVAAALGMPGWPMFGAVVFTMPPNDGAIAKVRE